jgi:glycerol uptake facilitator-like aquaporin
VEQLSDKDIKETKDSKENMYELLIHIHNSYNIINIYMIPSLKKYITEFLGTLLLAFVVLSTGNWMAIGSALAIGCYLGAPISGAAYNPAVALCYLASNKINTTEIVPYIVFEILGAMVAYCLYKMTLSSSR